MGRFAANFLFLFALILTTQNLHSQYVMQDVILLKTAEVVRGDIVENVQDEFVRIMLADSTMSRYDWSEIELITEEPKRDFRGRVLREEFERDKGAVNFRMIFDTGVSLGKDGEESASSLNFGIIPSVDFGGVVSLGFGTGLRVPFNSSSLVFPLNFDLRFSGGQKIAPILVLGGGYAYLIASNFDEGDGMGYAKVGVNIKSYSGGSVSLLIGIDTGPQLLQRESVLFFGRSIEFETPDNVTGFVASLAFSF